jgi:hypothetical protein
VRIWLVPFAELDNQRLIAQHHEWQAIWNMVTWRGYRWKGYEDPKYRLDLMMRHEEAVTELKLRGYPSGLNHTTPIPLDDRENQWEIIASTAQVSIPRPPETLRNERWTLLCRWLGEYQGDQRGLQLPEAFQDYAELAVQYKEQGGCLHDDVYEDLPDGTQLCLVCKKVHRTKPDGEWRSVR